MGAASALPSPIAEAPAVLEAADPGKIVARKSIFYLSISWKPTHDMLILEIYVGRESSEGVMQ